ncbi:MAG TPA: nucleotide exchange factor GrpE [Pyrinomonadaceae bacterium]|nr:nucleotide exchange factor GrpE [Pyrinomonadaceae bacterium]
MNPNQESEELDEIVDESGTDAGVSVDDFIKQLEEKEKDLHITAETTIIEIAEAFEGGELPDFMKGEFEFSAAKPAATEDAAPAKAQPTKADHKLEKEISQLKEHVATLEAEKDELRAATQRRAKDFETFKLRTERERKDTFETQVGNLATQMLPALDNLNRAVDFALAMPDEQRVEMQQFFDGIVLVSQQVNDVLAEMGVQPIAPVGQTFDPHYHEAVATEESEEFDPNTVSAELLRGYRIGDRVIRHSMVKVAKAPLMAVPAAGEVEHDPEDPRDPEVADENEPEDD